MYKIQSVDQNSFDSDFTQEFLSRRQSKQPTNKEEREPVLVAQTLSFMKAKEERSWQMHASPSQMSRQRLLYLDFTVTTNNNRQILSKISKDEVQLAPNLNISEFQQQRMTMLKSLNCL
jgi:hypothetical protein